jgi:hypothetical protein
LVKTEEHSAEARGLIKKLLSHVDVPATPPLGLRTTVEGHRKAQAQVPAVSWIISAYYVLEAKAIVLFYTRTFFLKNET